MANYIAESNRTYDMLELQRGEEIPYIKGREIRVDNIYCLDYKANKQDIQSIAKSRSLSLKTIRQAIEWCTLNDNLITIVLAEERREAGIRD